MLSVEPLHAAMAWHLAIALSNDMGYTPTVRLHHIKAMNLLMDYFRHVHLVED